MRDEADKPDEQDADADEQALRCGALLAQARRDQQISVLEIAKELHLDETKVRALESNEFESLGAPVFAKGHLRKYSQLVGVDPDDVLTDYYRLTRSQAIPPVVSQRAKPRRELAPGPWIAVAAVVAAIAAVYWLITMEPAEPVVGEASSVPETVSPQAPAGDVEQASTAPVEADTTEAGNDELPQEETTESVLAQQEESSPAQPAPAIAEGDVRLSITFLGDCWTEISDASGRRLFFNLGSEGQTVELAGQGPISVLFGDADNVSLQVNGSEYTIADSERRGRTARFSVSVP